MNIGSLFRGLMGDSKPGEARQVDLKEGQVVRGVVTSVSEDGQEAVVQIQGVKVRAKLETPLQQGATTLLQVQPPDKDGMPVLKPVTANSTNPLPNASVGEVLDSFNLPDTKENREMITQMRASGITLSEDNVKSIQSTLAQKPASVPVGEWVQSAAVAIQRGLPVTAQSVSGLQQAIFGPPLHDLLSNLDDLVRSTITQAQATGTNVSADTSTDSNLETMTSNPTATNPAVNGNPTTATSNNSTSALLGKLQAVLDQLGSIVAQSGEQAIDPNTNKMMPTPANNPVVPQSPTAPVLPANIQAQVADETAPTSATVPNNLSSASTIADDNQAVTSNTASANPATTASSKNQATEPWLGRVLKLLGAEHEQQVVRAGLNSSSTPESAATRAEQSPASLIANALTQETVDPAISRTANPPVPANGINGVLNNTLEEQLPAQNARPTNPASASVAQSTAGNEAMLISETEQQNTTSSKQTTANIQVVTNTQANTDADGLPNPLLPNQRGVAENTNPAQIAQQVATNTDDAVSKAQDTLKGILLQLTAADDVPPALKDAAQQLVQQLTGQQLLLNTDRTAPFAQVTMFVPFKGPDGQETASVQIQSRRGPKGELDASNCRLWFDLDMKSLGPTLVDVHVVDKIVTLKVHNDLEELAPLVESKREEMASAMGALGYQLLSLKVDMMPDRSSTSNDPSSTSDSDLLQKYAPPDYKGVDMKI